jgi:membrane-associated phospholipid phosphatase
MKQFILSVFFFFIYRSSFSQNADIDILKNINLNRNKNLDPGFLYFTKSAAPVSIISPVIIFTIGIVTKDSSLKMKGLYIGESLLAAAIISTTVKYSINRTRPYITYPYLQKAGPGGSPSFPSGHTSDAFATATSLSIAFPKWYIIAPSYLWAGIIAYSRMDLGVHYPSDVLAGAIIGAGTSYLCYKINQRMARRTL